MFRNSLIWKVTAAISLVFVPLVAAAAGDRTVTWYLDGSKVEQELAIENSYREFRLPATMKPDSLRVRPLSGTRITRVELEPVKPGRSEEKELARLDERRDELQDRLKALAVKEEIFKSTAKSQGSKAPRRTRTNPEPISSIRQGTDFAISRLEDVYRDIRKAERELRELERKQSSLRKNDKVAGSVAKLWLSSKRGRVQLSYLTFGEGWKPSYDIRISGGFADVTLLAVLPGSENGFSNLVASSLISTPASALPVNFGNGKPARVSAYRMPVVSENISGDLLKSVAFTLKNSSGDYLPPGNASGYLHEEFIGFTGFTGMKPSESHSFLFGIQNEKGLELKKPHEFKKEVEQ